MERAQDGLASIGLAPDVRVQSSLAMQGSGEPVDVIVRPEHVRITEEESPPTCQALRARVTETVFMGGSTDVAVEIHGLRLRAQVAPARLFTVGSNVWLSIAPEHVVTLPSGSSIAHTTQANAATAPVSLELGAVAANSASTTGGIAA